MRALTSLLFICATATAAHATDTWTTPHPGMRHLHRVTSTQNIHALVIDLCAPGVSIRATTHAERGRTVGSFGALVHAEAAINGNFFNLTTYETSGPAMGNGMAWGGGDSSDIAPFQAGDFRVALPAGASTAGVASWAKQVVSGRPSLIVGGVVKDASAASTCSVANPRTSLGLTADKQHLILAVVDGRETTHVGMTCNQLGALMKSLGAADAINLDGGGSSTMWLSGTVVNTPSDGVSRVVGNHLAVLAKGTGPAPNCPRPRYEATAVGGDTQLDMTSGEARDVTFEVANDSNVDWNTMVALGTQAPQDRDSAFYDPATWIAANRPVAVDPPIAADATGTLTWKLIAPAVTEPTTFVESFQLVHADATWFGPVQTLTINVVPGDGSGSGSGTGDGGGGGCNVGSGGGADHEAPCVGWFAILAAIGLVVRRDRSRRATRAS